MFASPPLLGLAGDWGNIYIKAALFAWLAAQFIKFTVAAVSAKKWDFTYFVSTGGMPSAHSASVCGLATRVGVETGLYSPVFAVSLWFALIVMFDAQSVRKAAGEQAQILNQIVEEVLQDHHLSQTKLKELLGHTRLEVLGGMLVGITVGLIV